VDFFHKRYKINSKHLLNRKIFIRIADNEFEICLKENFIEKSDIPFENVYIIDKYLYLIENDSDLIKIKRLIRKEKIKEFLEL
jgi:hypothetical protein